MEMNVSGRMNSGASSEKNSEEVEKLKTWKIGTKHFQPPIQISIAFCGIS
jgi:hypothetical protein